MDKISKISHILWLAIAGMFLLRITLYLLLLLTSSYVVHSVVSFFVSFTNFGLFGGTTAWFVLNLIGRKPNESGWVPSLIGAISAGMLAMGYLFTFRAYVHGVAFTIFAILFGAALLVAMILLSRTLQEKLQKLACIAAGAGYLISLLMYWIVWYVFIYFFGWYNAAPGLLTDIFVFVPFILFFYIFDANKPKELPKF